MLSLGVLVLVWGNVLSLGVLALVGLVEGMLVSNVGFRSGELLVL